MATEEIDKFKRMRTKTDKVINTTRMHAREGYDSAAKEYLMDDDGLLDYEKLEDEGVAQKFGEHAASTLQKYARRHFRSGVSEEADLENEMLLQAYTGITKAQIVNDAKQRGKDYTFEAYQKSVQDATDAVKKQLSDLSASHFTKEHIDDIVKYMKADEFIDSSKIRLQEATQLLDAYHVQKVIPADQVRKAVYAKKEYYEKSA